MASDSADGEELESLYDITDMNQVLLANLSDLDESLSDLTLVLRDGREIQTHKLILHLGSPVFRKMFGSKFLEGCRSFSRLTLPEDDPYSMQIMMDHIYGRDYDFESCNLSTKLNIWITSNKYDIPTLQQEALDEVKAILKRIAAYSCQTMETFNVDKTLAAIMDICESHAGAKGMCDIRAALTDCVCSVMEKMDSCDALRRELQIHPDWTVDLVKHVQRRNRQLSKRLKEATKGLNALLATMTSQPCIGEQI